MRRGLETIFPTQAIASLEQRLQQPEGFKSYGEVQQWLKTEYFSKQFGNSSK